MDIPYKNILVLNTELSQRCSAALVHRTHETLLCTDGAGNKLAQHGIIPDLVIGDFDSLDPSTLPPTVAKIHLSDPNTTDFEKALNYIQRENLGPTKILGLCGGEIDHTLGNVHALVKHHRTDGDFFFVDERTAPSKLGIVLTGRYDFASKSGAKVSLFPFSQAVVSSSGLQYELQATMLTQTAGVLGVRNAARGESFVLEVEQGMILVIMDL